MLFACILIWNTLFADLYIAWASLDDFSTGPHGKAESDKLSLIAQHYE